MTVHDVIYWIYKYVYLSRVNTGISKMSREAVITQPKNQTSKKITFTMSRSRIARTNSTLEIFIGIVDCRQKKTYHFQNLFYLICISHFLSASFPGKIISPFFIYRLTAPFPYRFRTLVSSLPMMSCAERLIFFMGFGFFQGFKVSKSDTLDQNIFSIYKTFTCYFWLRNAHKPNTKMQWFLITTVRRFSLFNLTMNMLLWLNILLSVDFVNPQGMSILGNFTFGYIGYIHRGLWPLYFWPTHQRQALTKVFHNSHSVNIICLPHCHSIFMIKKFSSPAKGEILAPAGKKGGCLVM